MILKQCEAISAKTPTNKSKYVFLPQITKPNKMITIFTKLKCLEHPVKQVHRKRPQISRPKIFKPNERNERFYPNKTKLTFDATTDHIIKNSNKIDQNFSVFDLN